MALIKKFTSQNSDQFIKEPGDQILGKFGHLNYLLRQINSSLLSFTPGSVLFSDSNGDPAGDPTQLYWDDVNNRIGIGLNTPTSALHVIGGANVAAPLGTLPAGYGTGATKLPQLTIEAVSPTNLNNRFLIKAGGFSSSTFFGVDSMASYSYTFGGAVRQNSAFGYATLNKLTSGYSNTAIGGFALQNLTTAAENTAVGLDALWQVIDGSSNTSVGFSSGGNLTSGIRNVFLGRSAGAGITTGNYNTVLGAFVTGLASTLSNTVILADGQGNRRLYVDNVGNAAFGTTTPAASAKLSVVSTTAGFLPPVMTGAQAEAIVSPAEGLMVYATAAGSGAITAKGWWGYNGSTWVQLG